jgi:hypothetical protein
VYPTPNNVKYVINFTYEDPLDDMTNSTDDFDFPHEWGLALVYNLAAILARPYKQIAELQELTQTAAMYKEQLKMFNTDDSPLQIKLSSRMIR